MNGCACSGEDLILVYITTPSFEIAQEIASAAIEEELAACANIMPAIMSVYRWQEQIEHAQEIPLVLKTKTGLFEKLCERVKTLHPYECPCIVGVPVTMAPPAFAQWVREQTSV